MMPTLLYGAECSIINQSRMKKLVFPGLVLLVALGARAQTAEEWFRQKETQKKYLLEQITALKVYGSYARKGYEIASQGWRTIQGIKEGDQSLHRAFFNALRLVSPGVESSPLVAGTITLASRSVGKISGIRHRLGSTGQLTAPEIKFCNGVLDGLLGACTDSLEELRLLTASGERELRDDERLQRLARLYAALQAVYGTLSSLGGDIDLLIAQRTSRRAEIHHAKKTAGLR
jgi:hypothetical protein